MPFIHRLLVCIRFLYSLSCNHVLFITIITITCIILYCILCSCIVNEYTYIHKWVNPAFVRPVLQMRNTQSIKEVPSIRKQDVW